MMEQYIVSISLVASVVGMMTAMIVLFTHSDSKLERCLRDMNEKLDKSMKENRDYIANVMKEIRSQNKGK
jgi:hypothetical protein